MLEDGLGEGLSQKPGAGLVLLADPGQVSAEVDQELVVGLRDAGRLQDPLQLLSALLHTLTLCKTPQSTLRRTNQVNSCHQMLICSLAVPNHFSYFILINVLSVAVCLESEACNEKRFFRGRCSRCASCADKDGADN